MGEVPPRQHERATDVDGVCRGADDRSKKLVVGEDASTLPRGVYDEQTAGADAVTERGLDGVAVSLVGRRATQGDV